MKAADFLQELKLTNKALSIVLTDSENETGCSGGAGCSLNLLSRALNGETVYINDRNLSCPGAVRGFGLSDGCPDIPGGFGHFISYGAGKGFPPGERIKNSPETAMAMINNQPADVLNGHTAIMVKPYDEGDDASLVTFLAEPDQLSGLVQLFSYRTGAYDNVIAPLCSGCASIFRIPLGELTREPPRAVIGNIDALARTLFDKNTFFFTVPAKSFREMLEDADNSFLITFNWKGVKARMEITTKN